MVIAINVFDAGDRWRSALTRAWFQRDTFGPHLIPAVLAKREVDRGTDNHSRSKLFPASNPPRLASLSTYRSSQKEPVEGL